MVKVPQRQNLRKTVKVPWNVNIVNGRRRGTRRSASLLRALAMSSPIEPPSPDPPDWGVNYTPTRDTPNGWAEYVGRRQARIQHGQNPNNPAHAHLFTPQFSSAFNWPTDEEAAAGVPGALRQLALPLRTDDLGPEDEEGEAVTVSVTPHTTSTQHRPAEATANTRAAVNGAPSSSTDVPPFQLPE